ncbi:MAG: ATP-binding protein [Acidimicrobiia bacterium]
MAARIPARWEAAFAPSRLKGFLIGFATVTAIALALEPFKDHLAVATPAPLMLIPVVLAGFFGSRLTAVLVAALAAVVYWLEFIPPIGSLELPLAEDLVSIGFFLVVAVAIGGFVARESEIRRRETSRADELAEMHRRLEAGELERRRLEAETHRIALLEEVDRQRTVILRAVSHDLRTPLNTINGVATDLLAGTSYPDETRDELLGLVAQEAQRLDRIVANLLSMSRIEAGALHPQPRPTDLAELVESCLKRVGPWSGPAHITTTLPAGLPLASVDYSQLDQVLTNLLENSIRHAPSATERSVTAWTEAGRVFLAVVDDGGGIAPDEAAQLFAPYAKPTSGLGLAVSRALTEANAGTLTFEPRSPGESRFVIAFPAVTAEDSFRRG